MGKHRTTIIISALVILILAAYWRVLGNGFINYDDDIYVYANRHIQQGITLQSLRWAFNAGYAGNWHPLTWISHMVDYRLFGDAPMGHHLVNLIFHILNTSLLLLVLRRMTGSLWKSAFVAALFAVHPLHVESVAWVAERKDVLSTMFWFLTMGAYVLYSEKPSIRRYVPVILLYALGLMAKPMLVTLPLALLLLDYWPLRRQVRISRLILEKIPLLAMAAGSSAITFIAQSRGGAVNELVTFPITTRIANAFVGYTTYLWKMIWPAKLGVLYPHPGEGLAIWKAAVSAVILVAVSIVVFSTRRKRPYLTVGWAWFLVTLVPVIGLVQVGSQAIADRYTYVPLIGLFIAIVWAGSSLIRSKRIAATFGITVVLALTAVTWVQVGYWRTSISLFEHTLKYTSGNYTIEDCLGQALAAQGDFGEATKHHEAALKINPNYPPALSNLGILLACAGRADEAITLFKKAAELEPDEPMVHFNLGVALESAGRTDEAIAEYQTCAAGHPDDPRVYLALGNLLEQRGKAAEAVDEYRAALQIDPSNAAASASLERLGEN